LVKSLEGAFKQIGLQKQGVDLSGSLRAAALNVFDLTISRAFHTS
jgi:hypothetical protein